MAGDRSRRIYSVLLSLTLLLSVSEVTLAAPNAAVRAACMHDAKRLCAAVLGNQEARMKCMKQHRAELSPECRAKIAEQRDIDGTRPASGGSSREKCAAMAADQHRLNGVGNQHIGGPAATKRCM